MCSSFYTNTRLPPGGSHNTTVYKMNENIFPIGNMPPACEAVLRTVGGAGGGDYHHPNKTNKAGSRRTTKVVRCTANYTPLQITLNMINKNGFKTDNII